MWSGAPGACTTTKKEVEHKTMGGIEIDEIKLVHQIMIKQIVNRDYVIKYN